MTNLSVNLNAVAYLRNRRDVPWPDLARIANLILDAGAHGITVHPRPDQRHIRFSDLGTLSEITKSHPSKPEFNIEGYPTDQFYDLVLKAQPTQVTLVPDDPNQSTSDHGWDIANNHALLTKEIAKYKGQGFTTSIFVDPTKDNAKLAHEVGADRIEIYTGPYGAAKSKSQIDKCLHDISELAEAINEYPNLDINAGHDLTVSNLPDLKRVIPNLKEVSIGHGITADSFIFGFPESVKRFLAIL